MKEPAGVIEFVSFYWISHAELSANVKKVVLSTFHDVTFP
jgi:hypothetical protein